MNFSQEMELIHKWFTPKRDNTCMNVEMTTIQWDGKKETIGQLVTDIMWTLTHNHPTLESTPFRVNELITKLAVKNFALADHLRTRQQQGETADTYHSLQVEAEAFMTRHASITKSAEAARTQPGDNRQGRPREGNFY